MKFEQDGWIFSQTPIWATCDPRLSDGAHRLFSYLAWRQGNDRKCWPSVARMAADLRCSRPTVRRRLRELEDVGYLQTTRRTGRSSHYSLVVDPNGASEAYTPRPSGAAVASTPPGGSASSSCPATPCRTDRPPPSRATATPVKTDGGPSSVLTTPPFKTDGPPPSEVTGTPVRSDDHDDKRGREARDREKTDELLAGRWETVLTRLRQQMERATYDLWLASATARREAERLVIELATPQALGWVSNRLDGVISRTVDRVFDDEGVAISYEVRDDGA